MSGRHKKELEHITRIFPKRLREIKGDKMSFLELSRQSGVAPSTLTNWSNGRTVPKLTQLVAVCNVLDASIDWVVGLDEISTTECAEDENERQDVLCDTQEALCDIEETEKRRE